MQNLRSQQLTEVPTLMPGTVQNIAICVSSTARTRLNPPLAVDSGCVFYLVFEIRPEVT